MLSSNPLISYAWQPCRSCRTDEGRGPGFFLALLGERVRVMRTRRGMTRKAARRAAGVSERHLANLETGRGNASVLLLRSSRARCMFDRRTGRRGAATRRSGSAFASCCAAATRPTLRAPARRWPTCSGRTAATGRDGRIALIGLRGAGKSTLGRMLADDLRVPFIELDRVIERIAGCDVGEIHSLYGPPAFRRYELRALEDTIAAHARAVIATGGGLVSEPSTYDLLLARCFTVWLRATPDDHMKRVIAQGDLRPMAGNAEAMEDLKRILAAREADYARADLAFDTSAQAAGPGLPRACAHAAIAGRMDAARGG